ncbi:MAG: aldo/keto reductase, partial [Bacilli bacterium]
MKHKKVGKSELYVSELGLGCMRIGTDYHSAKQTIDCALHAGVTLFDTADLYDNGENEMLLHRILRENGKLNDVMIATKGGNRMNDDGSSWSWDASVSYLYTALTESLRRLGRDYIDIYELHGGTSDDDLPAVIAAFESWKKEGLIRSYGISSIRPNVFLPFFNESNADVWMTPAHPLDRRLEEWSDLTASKNISVFARGALGKGVFTENALKNHLLSSIAG